MLTAKQIDSLPLGTFPNSVLRKKFGKHGTPVKFQDKDGNVHTFISNRWWSRFRKRNPLKPFKAKYNNIETEFQRRYGNSPKVKSQMGWLSKFFGAWMGWFNKMFK